MNNRAPIIRSSAVETLSGVTVSRVAVRKIGWKVVGHQQRRARHPSRLPTSELALTGGTCND